MAAPTPAAIRVTPATTEVNLDFNAGEDVDVELDVLDDDDQPVPVASAIAMIRTGPRSVEKLHEWSAAESNLTVGLGKVVLITRATETEAWAADWGDAEWDLEVTDLNGRIKRVCEGDVRVNPGRTH